MALSNLHVFFVLVVVMHELGVGANSAVVMMQQLAGRLSVCQINCLDFFVLWSTQSGKMRQVAPCTRDNSGEECWRNKESSYSLVQR